METFCELIQQTATSCEHNVIEQHWPDLNIYSGQSCLDHRCDGVLLIWCGVAIVSESCLGIEQSLGDSEALNAKHLVPAVWHFEWSWWQALDRVDVDVVSHAVHYVELTRALPYLHHALLEGREDALFLVLPE